MATPKKLCLIYHVFNTLTERHIDLSLQSLAKLKFNWESLIVFNTSTDPRLCDEAIAEGLVRYNIIDKFDKVMVAEKGENRPASITADFLAQFETIEGYDAYLVHKADFYVGPNSIQAIEELFHEQERKQPHFANFKKFDLREYVSDDRVVELGNYPTYTSILDSVPTAEPWESGMWNVECEAVGYDGLDGVMHAYTDSARKLANAPVDEITRSWGYCSIFDHMIAGGAKRIVDDRLYALHVYHEVPTKTGPEPRMRVGYRY